MNGSGAVSGVERSAGSLYEIGCQPEKTMEELTCLELVSRVYHHIEHVLINAITRQVYMTYGFENAQIALGELLTRDVDKNIKNKAEALLSLLQTINVESVATDKNIEDINEKFLSFLASVKDLS